MGLDMIRRFALLLFDYKLYSFVWIKILNPILLILSEVFIYLMVVLPKHVDLHELNKRLSYDLIGK